VSTSTNGSYLTGTALERSWGVQMALDTARDFVERVLAEDEPKFRRGQTARLTRLHVMTLRYLDAS